MSFECEYCLKTFEKESSLVKHQEKCMRKQRYDNRNSPGPRIGFMLYQDFYRMKCRKHKQPDFKDFIRDRSYLMFEDLGLKIGSIHPKYQSDVIRFMMKSTFFTLHDFSKMAPESIFEVYTRDKLLMEKPVDAINRSLVFIKEWCELEGYGIPYFFERTSCADAVELIYLGEISPWVWAVSLKSRDKWLSRMTSSQIDKVYRVYSQNSWEWLIKQDRGTYLGCARSELLKCGLFQD